jgi:hypothetical protein
MDIEEQRAASAPASDSAPVEHYHNHYGPVAPPQPQPQPHIPAPPAQQPSAPSPPMCVFGSAAEYILYAGLTVVT